MKTDLELFGGHSRQIAEARALLFWDFNKALIEHDQEIKDLIDDMELGEMPEFGFTEWELMAKGYDKALTELKNKLGV